MDKDQGQVASISFKKTSQVTKEPDAPDTYLTLVADSSGGKAGADSTVTLKNVQQMDAPQDAPDDISMPLGMISFNAEIENQGDTETFSIYLDSELEINGYWKQNTSGDWVNLASSDYGGSLVTEGGKLRLDFQIQDGGEFDGDGVADGVITDPGAPGYREISSDSPDNSDGIAIFRFYHPDVNVHMFTASANEAELLNQAETGWQQEGIAFTSSQGGNQEITQEVYRFYHPILEDHFFTSNAAEAQLLLTEAGYGYTYEGVAFYLNNEGDDQAAISRYYNPHNGEHFYTANPEETVTLLGQMGFVYEGILGYGI